MASAAHVGMGLFIDGSGQDHYRSTGPSYNAACAWDHSACLLIDAGSADDHYRWPASNGPARADFGGWSVFAELGGRDTYESKTMLRARESSLATFYEASGEDNYDGVRAKRTGAVAENSAIYVEQGALFIDR